MSMVEETNPYLLERSYKKVIIFLVNFYGFMVFVVFGINGIVVHHKENKDGPHDYIQSTFMVCAGAVAIQTAFLYIKTLWNLESIICRVALASLTFELVCSFVLSSFIMFDKKDITRVVLVQVLLSASVLGGIIDLVVYKDCERNLNQVGKHHTDDKIKLLEGEKRNLELELLESKKENEKLAIKLKETQESMEDETKALTKQSKLKETEKKRLGIDLAVKREREAPNTHSLQAEKLRKMEEEASRMKVEIRVLKELHEHDYLNWEKNVESIAMLTYKKMKEEKWKSKRWVN